MYILINKFLDGDLLSTFSARSNAVPGGQPLMIFLLRLSGQY